MIVKVYLKDNSTNNPQAIKPIEITDVDEVERDGPFLTVSVNEDTMPDFYFNIDQVVFYTLERSPDE